MHYVFARLFILPLQKKFLYFNLNVMDSKSDNIEIMINHEADEVKKNFFSHSKIDIKIILNQ